MNSHLVLDICRVLYVGMLGAIPVHQASTHALLVGMETSFDLSINGATTQKRVVWVQSQTLHALDFHGSRAAVFFLDPGYPLPECVEDPVTLISAIDQVLEAEGAGTWNVLLQSARLPSKSVDQDPRMVAIAKRLISNADESLSAAELAASVRLSVSRVEHLFRSQFGVPLRAFRSWYRFRLAAKQLLSGGSITDAAHAAGFHDSAHFSNAFRDTFGLTPSHVFNAGLQGFCID